MTVNIAVVGRTIKEASMTLHNMVDDGRVREGHGQTIRMGKGYASIVRDRQVDVHFVAVGLDELESFEGYRFNVTVPCDTFPEIMKLEKARMLLAQSQA